MEHTGLLTAIRADCGSGRAQSTINITDNQAGGRKGRRTADHVLKVHDIINHNKINRKNTYITFLDVTKAYDKAWLEAIMYVLNTQGCKGALWNLTDKLNQYLTATIRTKHGLTRPISIKNSITAIRQGLSSNTVCHTNG